MIEFRLLEQLVAFSTYGTLSEAAEKLHTSQPALSRSMKQLESEFGVSLFVRSKNRLILTPTGQKAAEFAKQVLEMAAELPIRVREYDRKLHTISVGFCAPVPQTVLTPIISAVYGGMTLSFDMMDDSQFLEKLDQGIYQLAVMHEAPSAERFFYKKIGHEDLYISVVPQHPLAARQSITLKELDGLSILLLHDIGFWSNMHLNKTPNTRYLHQLDRAAYNDIAVHTPFPIFSSSYYLSQGIRPTGRVSIPIPDPEAHTDYFLVCLRSEAETYKELFQQVNAQTI